MIYNVLLVDDEPSFLTLISRSFEGNEVFKVRGQANSVKDAKEILKTGEFHVIFTDIMMHGETGIDLIKYVMENHSDIMVVVLSGYDDYQYVRESFKFGAEDYLLKPVSPLKFSKFLESITERLKNRFVAEKPEINEETLPDNLIDEIKRYLEENLDSSISTVCKKFHISQPYLSKLFRKNTNSSFNNFLNELKIKKAIALLLSPKEYLVGEIAEQCAFSDQFYFSKVFKLYTNMTPSEYRKQNMQ